MARWKSRLFKSLGPAVMGTLVNADRIRTLLEHPKSKSAKILTELTVSAIKDAYLSRRPVVWTSLSVPSEIVLASGAVPFSPEIITPTIAWLGIERVCLLESERLGVSNAFCTSHRTAVGAISLDLLPRPDALVLSSDLCRANIKAFTYASEYFNRPLFVLDIPAKRDQTACAYIAFQLGQLVEFLSNAVKVNFARDGLAAAVRNSNKARESFMRMNELRRVVAFPSGEAMGLTAMTPHFGRVELIDFLDVLRHEMANSPKVAGRPRLLWLNEQLYAPPSVLERINEQGASIVFEEANQVYWPELDPGRPLTSLGEKILSHYARGPLEKRIAKLVELASEYQVDGVVSSTYPRCGHGTVALPYILDRLSQAGIPCISLDEPLDTSKNEEDDSPLDEFLETLRTAA